MSVSRLFRLLAPISTCFAILTAPCIASDDPDGDQGKTPKKGSWQIVLSAKEKKKLAKEQQVAAQNPPRQNALPAAVPATALEKKDRADPKPLGRARTFLNRRTSPKENQEEILNKTEKEELLGRAERMGSYPLLRNDVSWLIMVLQPEMAWKPSLKYMEDYLHLMACLQEQPKNQHQEAILNIYPNTKVPEAQNDSYVMASLLNPIPAEARPFIAAKLFHEARNKGLLAMEKYSLRLFSQLDPQLALEALTFALDHDAIAYLRDKPFNLAFGELMSLLFYGQEYRPQPLSTQLSYLKIILTQEAIRKLYRDDFKDRELAWQYIMETSDVNSTIKLKLKLYKTVLALIEKNEKQGYPYGERFGWHCSLLLLRIAAWDNRQLDNLDVIVVPNERLTTLCQGVFLVGRERAGPVLRYMLEHKDSWTTPALGVTTVGALTVFQILDSLSQIELLGQEYWSQALSLHLLVHPAYPKLIGDHYWQVRNIPLSLRATVFQMVWGSFQAEASVIARYQSQPSSATALVETVRCFPESEIISALSLLLSLKEKLGDQLTSFSLSPVSHSIRKLEEDLRFPALKSFMNRFLDLGLSWSQAQYHFEAYPYLPHDSWLKKLDRWFGLQRFSYIDDDILIDWYKDLSPDDQNAVHDFWRNELMKPSPNQTIAKMIMRERDNFPDSLMDLVHCVFFQKRKEIMAAMQSTNAEIAREAADDVMNNPSSYGIRDGDEDDDVYQEALYILCKTEKSKETKAPYNVYKKLEELSQEVINHRQIRSGPVRPDNGRYSYYVTSDAFKCLRVNQVTYSQLPAHSKTYLRDMRARISAKKVVPELTFIGALGGGHLESQLYASPKDPKNPNEIVPTLSAKMIAIVAYFQSLSNEVSGEEPLPPQEQEFMVFIENAQNCQVNKDEVIHKYYTTLPENHRLPRLITITDSSEEQVRQVIERSLLDVAEKVCSCETPFVRELCGLHMGQRMQNGTHQERFVKNLLNSEIPFYPKIQLDLYTLGSLEDRLLRYTKGQVLKILFEQHINVADLVDAARTAINHELQQPNSTILSRINDFLGNKKIAVQWEYDEQTNRTTIQTPSVYELLYQLKILKKQKA